MSIEIESYNLAPAAYHPYDPAFPQIARLLADHIVSSDHVFTVEHIGSTAVPGCGGKGIIDLMLLYPPGHLADACNLLDDLGFQHQPQRDPFPESRPMRVGSIAHAGKRHRLHVHVICADSDEAVRLRAFRDRLIHDPSFRAAYEFTKQEIVAAGVTDASDYTEAKAPFITRDPNP